MSPLGDLTRDLRDHDAPDFAWVIEHAPDGDVVAAVVRLWRGYTPGSMDREMLLAELGRLALAPALETAAARVLRRKGLDRGDTIILQRVARTARDPESVDPEDQQLGTGPSTQPTGWGRLHYARPATRYLAMAADDLVFAVHRPASKRRKSWARIADDIVKAAVMLEGHTPGAAEAWLRDLLTDREIARAVRARLELPR